MSVKPIRASPSFINLVSLAMLCPRKLRLFVLHPVGSVLALIELYIDDLWRGSLTPQKMRKAHLLVLQLWGRNLNSGRKIRCHRPGAVP